ncbi:bifunctional adenosylcobinamide kinase/adenosylcobinamide-phosphate guanylyltransferase [Desulfurivibrio dismutans]|uniref:bifunctional adenosylcobinamide kinase/adenosylcobinamide-phosphate guanylyltransferase n=1 Tax=Desulfurivibrio dismutans TaxID=1398908 RepID=UPI0023DCAAB7|nr:bifunctional adenosylcobinamide kinase/adenosylcobinamide-phosphate guanylyltransferase [Desulfurivibrio alkaliphilus]MDF1614229.1 bifunctional adenosylcobinamide kinase/adenosylcobinamide-phosphate guanylyltransferase [Desulfurivibrio alkaliphilus]
MRELILGGVRSGKSSLAERLAAESGLAVTYLATARADDVEMQERIRHHQASRPTDWGLVEVKHDLAAVLAARMAPERCLLVDCLTLWLTGLLLAEDENLLAAETAALLALLPDIQGRLIMVGNETGLGVVPMGALTRRFCDEAGRLHQRLAARCDRVIMTVAGLPQVLKGEPTGLAG